MEHLLKELLDGEPGGPLDAFLNAETRGRSSVAPSSLRTAQSAEAISRLVW